MIKNLGQSPRCTKIFSIIFFTAVCNFLFISCNNSELSFTDSPVDYVNPLIGSDSSFENSENNKVGIQQILKHTNILVLLGVCHGFRGISRKYVYGAPDKLPRAYGAPGGQK